MTRIVCATAALAWLTGCAPVAEETRPPERLLVLAAVSLTEALQEAGRTDSEETGQPVRFSLAASNVLARQVREGIAADVIISADEPQMDSLQRAGLIDTGTRVPLLGNVLVVAVGAGFAGEVAGPRDLLGDDIRRVAIGDPAGVPAGVYARQYLERTGAWADLAPRLVPTSSVRAALAAVAQGHADAAFVYRTDVTNAAGVRVAFEATGPAAPHIVYPAAVLTASPHAAAAGAFVRWLRGEVASEIFRRHGFKVPPPS